MAPTTWPLPHPNLHHHASPHGESPPHGERALLAVIALVLVAVILLKLNDARGSRPGADNSQAGIEIVPVSKLPQPQSAADLPQAAVSEPAVKAPSMPVVSGPPAASGPQRSAAGVLPEDQSIESPQPPAQPQAAPAPAQSQQPTNIRAFDLARVPALQDLTARFGGSLGLDSVTYGQLSGVGAVAIVPVDSGGNSGSLADAIVGLDASGPVVISVLAPDVGGRGGLRASLENGEVIATSAIFGPEDALCCPSQLKRVTYAWDGSSLEVVSQQTISPASADLYRTP